MFLMQPPSPLDSCWCWNGIESGLHQVNAFLLHYLNDSKDIETEVCRKTKKKSERNSSYREGGGLVSECNGIFLGGRGMLNATEAAHNSKLARFFFFNLFPPSFSSKLLTERFVRWALICICRCNLLWNFKLLYENITLHRAGRWGKLPLMGFPNFV